VEYTSIGYSVVEFFLKGVLSANISVRLKWRLK